MNSISVLVVALFLWPFSGSKTYHMTADRSVAAASGDVSVHRGGANRNTELDIKVANLARPASLASPGNVYIVWLRPNNQAAANQGALRVNNNLDGELKVATTSKTVTYSSRLSKARRQLLQRAPKSCMHTSPCNKGHNQTRTSKGVSGSD